MKLSSCHFHPPSDFIWLAGKGRDAPPYVVTRELVTPTERRWVPRVRAYRRLRRRSGTRGGSRSRSALGARARRGCRRLGRNGARCGQSSGRTGSSVVDVGRGVRRRGWAALRPDHLRQGIADGRQAARRSNRSRRLRRARRSNVNRGRARAHLGASLNRHQHAPAQHEHSAQHDQRGRRRDPNLSAAWSNRRRARSARIARAIRDRRRYRRLAHPRPHAVDGHRAERAVAGSREAHRELFATRAFLGQPQLPSPLGQARAEQLVHVPRELDLEAVFQAFRNGVLQRLQKDRKSTRLNSSH